MADINIIEKLQKLMITTKEEDKQYLNEIIDELQQSKKTRGRPRKHNKENEDIIKKRPVGRPRLHTIEEAKERVRQYDLRRYRENREKKIEMVKRCQRAKKEREKLKLEETKTN